MKTIVRVIFVVLFAYGTVMGLMSLQYFFDRGDLRRASKVIYDYQPRPGSSKKLVEYMAEGYQVDLGDLYCETTLASRFEGHVMVECGKKLGFVSERADINFQWVVDLVGSRIEPKNQRARQLADRIASIKGDQNGKTAQ